MGWFIFGGIILLIAIILMLSISFELNIEENADFRIRYALFSIVPWASSRNKKKKKQQTLKHKANKSKSIKINSKNNNQKPNSGNNIDDKNNSETEKKAEKLSTAPPKTKEKKVKQKIDFIMIKSVFESLGHPLKKLVRKIRINELYIKSTVSGNDAAATAINYGLQCAAISTALSWLDAVMRVSIKEVVVNADFSEGKKSDFFIHCKIKIRIITLLVCLAAFIKKYFKSTRTISNS